MLAGGIFEEEVFEGLEREPSTAAADVLLETEVFDESRLESRDCVASSP